MHRVSLLRLAIGGLALYGAGTAYLISEQHLSGARDCPLVGPMPACLVVLAGYTAMLVFAFRPQIWIFFVGWLPVFVLATTGVTAEWASNEPVCPQTAGGIPKCYLSFAFSLLLGFLALCHSRFRFDGQR